MISNKRKFALRATLLLAVESKDTYSIRIAESAEELKIPTPYLVEVLQELVPKTSFYQ